MNPFVLLLEIGVEELPSSFVDAALSALPGLVRDKLAQLRIAHGAVEALGTPRRLAVLVADVAGAQSDVDEEVVGPPEAAAFKGGAPTRAAEAFAEKLGVPVAQLEVKELSGAAAKKPGRYVVGRRVEAGRPSRELLGAALAEICGAIPFRKSMRWGSGEVAFGRPVQWLVALAGDAEIAVTFAGVTSGRVSRGHRFLSAGPIVIARPETYKEQLRAEHVVCDRDERARVMMQRVAAAATAMGGTHDPEPGLVSENASLVEEPHIVVGSFDEAFLALPAAVIRAVARGHQKYFCVQADASGDVLLPGYLAVANTAQKPENVARGNDRVMRARLSDARFFFDEDKKVRQEARVEKLAGIVFHNRLGTVREKVDRMGRIAAHLAGELGLGEAQTASVARAALLAKNDLVALMVGEFPELQGTMGRVYAGHAGEAAEVCDAIRDHYAPVGADGDVAASDVARIVALADRLDSLVGCFAVGLQPTGTADPYALRRATIGILRTLLESGDARYASIDLLELFAYVYRGFSDKKLDLSELETVAKVGEFASERLRGLIESRTSRASADAVMAGGAFVRGKHVAVVSHPPYALARARALEAVIGSGAAWLDKARTVAKRLSGISKESAPELVAKSALPRPGDQAIVDLVQILDEKTRALIDEEGVREALLAMGSLALQVDAIFTETLVNDPADASTPRRLSLLSYGAGCMLRIADFSRIGG